MSALVAFPAPPQPTASVRGVWLQEALAREGGPAPEPLVDDVEADVCVVGGGYTGLWTALALRDRAPGLDVVVLEADICAGGASGRNGGFVMTWWSKFASLEKRCGTAAAVELGRRSEAAVAAIGAFCRDNAIDAGFHQSGWLWTATNPAQVGAWEGTLDALAAAGVQPYETLDRRAVATLSGSPAHIAGVFERNGAIVQPAALGRGLHAVARRRGVRVHEHTPAVAVDDGPTLRVRTPTATVTAQRVVLAINAWAAALPDVRRSLVVVSSDVIATAPAPERLHEIGWSLEVGVSDSRRLINYYRPTDEGRVVFGKGGGTLALGGRVTRAFTGPSDRTQELQAQFRRLYPALWDVPVMSSWRGPIDYSVTGLPFLSTLGRPDLLVAAGFSGNGVGPSYIAGQALADMVLDGRDAVLPDALTRIPSGALPPEPIRYAGGLLVRSAIARKERAEDLGRNVGPLTRAVASLDPTSTVDRGKGGAASPTPGAARGLPALTDREMAEARNGHGPVPAAAVLGDGTNGDTPER